MWRQPPSAVGSSKARLMCSRWGCSHYIAIVSPNIVILSEVEGSLPSIRMFAPIHELTPAGNRSLA